MGTIHRLVRHAEVRMVVPTEEKKEKRKRGRPTMAKNTLAAPHQYIRGLEYKKVAGHKCGELAPCLSGTAGSNESRRMADLTVDGGVFGTQDGRLVR